MKKLSLAIIVLLVAIASCTKKSASTAAAAPDGAKIFASDCARCHGAQGVKDSRTPNLQTIALDKTGLIQSITKGKGHMPAFEDKLSAAEIAAVADLIVSWHK
ncbi:MAG TPA: cytochrome c [Chitinophagales bacterium]|nr:cytochrome c [Chitinophagales bacterium]